MPSSRAPRSSRQVTARLGAASVPGTASRSWRGAPSRWSRAAPFPATRPTARRATSRRRSKAILVTSIYLPNGNPQPGPKFAYKLAWLERLLTHAEALAASGHPVILAGDYNVVPTDADIYATRSWLDNALLQPEPREAFRRLLAQGWTDAIRALHPEARIYTFWDRLRNGWPRDAGLRIDHLLLSPSIRSRLLAAGVDRELRGREHASDHAPAWLELGPAVKRSRRARG